MQTTNLDRYSIELPSNVASFEAHDFGNYGPRGFNPSAKNGIMGGVPISYLFSGEWLKPSKAGRAGTMFVFHDASGAELGRAHMPSEYASNGISKLTFVPSKA